MPDLGPNIRVILFLVSCLLIMTLTLKALFEVFSKNRDIWMFHGDIFMVPLFSYYMLIRFPLIIEDAKARGVHLLVSGYLLSIIIFIRVMEVIRHHHYRRLINVFLLVFALPCFNLWIPYWSYYQIFFVILLMGLAGYDTIDTYFFYKKDNGIALIKAALDKLNDGIVFCNRFGQASYINEAMWHYLQAFRIPTHIKATEQYQRLKQAAYRGDDDSGYFLREGNRYLYLKGSFENGKLSQFYLADVTQQEQLNNDLQSAINDLKDAVCDLRDALGGTPSVTTEHERKIIRGDVHDTLAQKLSILRLAMERPQTISMADLKSRLMSFSDYDRNEHPEQLENIIYVLSLIDVELTVDGQLPEDEKYSALILKIIKEASTNAIRHGNANHIHVDLKKTEDGLHLVIRNNGSVPDTIQEGNGLRNIRYRLERVQGRLTTNCRNGFALEAYLPYAGNQTTG